MAERQAVFGSFLLCSIIFSLILIPRPVNSILYFNCSPIYFTSTTPYQLNVDHLFRSIVESASVSNFNHFEISEFSQNYVVYGNFQCRGDLTHSNCRNCVASSVSQLKTHCPVSIGGTIQLEGCFVKYDNTSFYGYKDRKEMSKRCGPSVNFNSYVLKSMYDVLEDLIASKGHYFRASRSGSVKGMAQCIEDLSLSQCQGCLSKATRLLRSECGTSSWGDMYLAKCYIRYADQGIYNNDAQPINDRNGSSENNNFNIVWELVTGIGILAVIVVAVGGLYFSCCRNMNNINVNSGGTVHGINLVTNGQRQ